MNQELKPRPAKDLSKIVVVDVESTCWDGPAPAGMQSEILQIGWAVLDTADLIVARSGMAYVQPVRSGISAFCTGLTGITQEDVKHARELGGVLEWIACGPLCDAAGCTWASWGDYDRRMFLAAAEVQPLAFPWDFSKHINIRRLHALGVGAEKEATIPESLQDYGLEFEGRLHDGMADARNAARVLAKILWRARQE